MIADLTAATMTTSLSFCAVMRDLAEPEAKFEIRCVREVMAVLWRKMVGDDKWTTRSYMSLARFTCPVMLITTSLLGYFHMFRWQGPRTTPIRRPRNHTIFGDL